MGRASRKKNRPRGQAGGLYSQFKYSSSALNILKNVMPKNKKDVSEWEKETTLSLLGSAAEIEDVGKMVGAQSFVYSLTAFKFYPQQHLYLSSDKVIDFLKNIKLKETDINKLCNYFSVYEKNIIFIHLKNEKHSYAIFVRNNIIYIRPSFDNSKGESLEILRNPKYPELIFNILKKDGLLNLVINTFLYMDAFPEAVRQGPPPVRMPVGQVSGHNTIIGESSAIKEMYRHGITPHMRRGHFRFLQSDKFKKKRFQTIYIKPTMIKGYAEHIVEAV